MHGKPLYVLLQGTGLTSTMRCLFAIFTTQPKCGLVEVCYKVSGYPHHLHCQCYQAALRPVTYFKTNIERYKLGPHFTVPSKARRSLK